MEERGGGARRGDHGGAPRERSAAALVELTRGALGAAMEELAPGVHGAAATTSYVAAGHARPQIRWSGANIQPRRAKMQQRAGGGLCGGRTTNMEADGILWVFIMTATANVRTHEKQAVSGSARSAGTMKCVCT